MPWGWPGAMVAAGITRSRLLAENELVSLVADPGAADLAATQGSTRSAAAAVNAIASKRE